MNEKLKGKKLFWFRSIAIAMPMVILIVLELLLRLFGYGHDTGLFIRYPDNKDYFALNKYASERFFSDTINSTKGSIELFRIEKRPNTYRIFVLGESTTAGYPYFHNGSFHRWLKYRLMQAYPDINFEIINVSLTAVNSYTVLDFGKQIRDYNPDAVLCYVGHNEYYGALGIGSTSHIGNNRLLVKTVLQLRKLRFVQLIESILHKTSGHDATVDNRDNLMERMASKQQIPYQSAEYLAGVNQFRENMDEFCNTMQEANVPVFLSTLVSNEKDLKPFISDQKKSISANGSFAQANVAYQKGDFTLAKLQYKQAKDLDMLRFRAPEAMDTIVIDLCKKYSSVHLVDSKSLFEKYSTHQILGHETLLEHVHPNLFGYALLSQAFYEAIRKVKLIKGLPGREISFDELIKQMPVTKVDSLYGAYTIMILKTGWPFKIPIPKDFKPGPTEEEQLAGALSVNNISWLDAINSLFQYSMKNNDKNGALRADEAALLEYPENPTYQIYAARLSFDVGDYDKSLFYFKKIYDNDPSLSNTENMYQAFIKTDQPERSVKYIQSAMHMQGGVNLSGLYEKVNEIINLKSKLSKNVSDSEVRNKIAFDYQVLGADEASKKYRN